MTTSAYTPAPTYTISGIGPYDAPFEYTASSEIEVYYTDGDGIAVAAAPADFSVVPEGPTTSGTVFLTPAAATGEWVTIEGVARRAVRSTTFGSRCWIIPLAQAGIVSRTAQFRAANGRGRPGPVAIAAP